MEAESSRRSDAHDGIFISRRGLPYARIQRSEGGPVRILLVEDDPETASALARGISLGGHDVSVAGLKSEALQLLEGRIFDAAILDVGLPDGEGYEVVEALRSCQPETWILMLTARGSVDDRVEGLDRGADDYLVKPFSIAELAATLRARERRPGRCTTEVRSDDLALDLLERRATIRGERIELTGTEFSLLFALLRDRGVPRSRRALLQEVWGYDFDPGTNVVEVHVNRLRRKLEAHGVSDLVRTVRGAGYAAG
jgi:DNA-binding response OmpR family regulator